MLLLLIALLLLGVPQATSQQTATCANVWESRRAEVEELLRTAPVEKIVEIPIGVTKPKRAYIEGGGPTDSFAWKPLAPGRYQGFWESYKAEIAAYELDKMLELNMVPVVVERRIKGDLGAAVLWLQDVRSWEAVQPLPKPPNWGHQIARMKMFDNYIGNSDRNKGNMLIDQDWHMYLIDHSRGFAQDQKLPQVLENIDRRLWNHMLELDEAKLTAELGKLLDRRQIRSMIQRRDHMKKAIDALVAKHGERIFF